MGELTEAPKATAVVSIERLDTLMASPSVWASTSTSRSGVPLHGVCRHEGKQQQRTRTSIGRRDGWRSSDVSPLASLWRWLSASLSE